MVEIEYMSMVDEWPHEKLGEQKSSLSRKSPLSDKNIKVLNDGVF